MRAAKLDRSPRLQRVARLLSDGKEFDSLNRLARPCRCGEQHRVRTAG